MNTPVASFRVIEHDDYGKSVRCSYCPRDVKRVVVLPLTDRSEADDGDEGLGLCSYCVRELARARARAQGTL